MAQENPVGFFAGLRRLGATALAVVYSRLELLSVEWREERIRASSILLWSAFFVALVFMAMIAVTCLFVVAFWEQAFWVLLGFTIVYAVGAFAALKAVVRQMKEPVFAETIHQLKKDQEWLLGPKS